MKTCYIVGAGDFGDGTLCPREEDLVIACDGGYAHCMERGIRMDLVAGDFDSLGYLPVSALRQLTGFDGCCDACFTGSYPTPVPADNRKDRFERKLSERKT